MVDVHRIRHRLGLFVYFVVSTCSGRHPHTGARAIAIVVRRNGSVFPSFPLFSVTFALTFHHLHMLPLLVTLSIHHFGPVVGVHEKMPIVFTVEWQLVPFAIVRRRVPDAFAFAFSFSFTFPIQSRHGYHNHSVSLALQRGMFPFSLLFALLQVQITFERHTLAFSLFVQCSITFALSVDCHCALFLVSVSVSIYTVARGLSFRMRGYSHGHTSHSGPHPIGPLSLSLSVSLDTLNSLPLHSFSPFPVCTICKRKPITILAFSLSFAFPEELVAFGEAADRRKVSFSFSLTCELVLALAGKVMWMGRRVR